MIPDHTPAPIPSEFRHRARRFRHLGYSALRADMPVKLQLAQYQDCVHQARKLEARDYALRKPNRTPQPTATATDQQCRTCATTYPLFTDHCPHCYLPSKRRTFSPVDFHWHELNTFGGEV